MNTYNEHYKQFAGAMALLLGSLAPALAVGDNEFESYYLNHVCHHNHRQRRQVFPSPRTFADTLENLPHLVVVQIFHRER